MKTTNQKEIVKKIHKSYETINFTKRYKQLYSKHNFSLDELLTRMNKKDNLNIFKELGYEFKISSPGQYYNFEEKFDEIKLSLSCQISKGMVFPYIYVYVNGNKISKPYSSKISFTYRYLMNIPRLQALNSLCFRDLDDLKNILKDLLGIYEDFKEEFLKLMEIENINA